MKQIDEIRAKLTEKKPRSAWNKGVITYSLELLNDLDKVPTCAADLLNGAKDWNQYSWGGCSLIYDSDIATRLCSPSELKKNRNAERRPNSREEWLDVQARALSQACRLILDIANT